MPKYIYNTQTCKLHIENYCHWANTSAYNTLLFDTEDDALAYDGRAVSFCKLCQNKREKELTNKKL